MTERTPLERLQSALVDASNALNELMAETEKATPHDDVLAQFDTEIDGILRWVQCVEDGAKRMLED